VKVHPLLKVAFASPALAGLVRLRGTRALARTLLPHALKHAPWLLSIYLNPEHIDLASLDEIVRTVEDPNRFINREIARWVAAKDLVLAGRNVSEAITTLRTPLLCVVANGDGIVPRE